MRSVIVVLAVLCSACRDEVPLFSGLDQPVRVEEGFFLEGELAIDDGGPVITSLEATNSIAVLGQDSRGLRGRTRDDAWAVGLRFVELGSGWWIRDVGDLAAQYPGDRDFSIDYDLGGGIPPGLHAMRVAAIDEDGARGPAYDFDLCVLEDPASAGLNPCDPSLPPPAVVFGVAWNRDVDLDLVLVGPGGRTVRWKSPTTAMPQNGVVPARDIEDPTVGKLNRDSNAACIADGRNAEAVVWEEPPPAGTWSAYVDLFDACGHRDVTFVVSVYRRRPRGDGTWRLVETERRRGALVAELDAFGGAKPALFVLSAELP